MQMSDLILTSAGDLHAKLVAEILPIKLRAKGNMTEFEKMMLTLLHNKNMISKHEYDQLNKVVDALNFEDRQKAIETIRVVHMTMVTEDATLGARAITSIILDSISNEPSGLPPGALGSWYHADAGGAILGFFAGGWGGALVGGAACSILAL